MRKWKVWKAGLWFATSPADETTPFDTWDDAHAWAYWNATHEMNEVP